VGPQHIEGYKSFIAARIGEGDGAPPGIVMVVTGRLVGEDFGGIEEQAVRIGKKAEGGGGQMCCNAGLVNPLTIIAEKPVGERPGPGARNGNGLPGEKRRQTGAVVFQELGDDAQYRRIYFLLVRSRRGGAP